MALNQMKHRFAIGRCAEYYAEPRLLLLGSTIPYVIYL